MVNKKYRFKRSDETGENSSSKAVVVSVICLFAPVWVPILWLNLATLFDLKSVADELYLVLSLGLPFLPFVILINDAKALKTYLLCLLLASPFLLIAAFILGRIAAFSVYGP